MIYKKYDKECLKLSFRRTMHPNRCLMSVIYVYKNELIYFTNQNLEFLSDIDYFWMSAL